MGCFNSRRSKSALQVTEGPRISFTTRRPARIQINSARNASSIRKSECTPLNSEREALAFNCPICLRFFSCILATACCGHYICHACADELVHKDLDFEVACPHCRTEPVILADADPAQGIRKYSDSPIKVPSHCHTPLQNNDSV